MNSHRVTLSFMYSSPFIFLVWEQRAVCTWIECTVFPQMLDSHLESACWGRPPSCTCRWPEDRRRLVRTAAPSSSGWEKGVELPRAWRDARVAKLLVFHWNTRHGEGITIKYLSVYTAANGDFCIWCIHYGHFCLHWKSPTVAHLGPGVLFAEQVRIEVGHLEVSLVCKAPHQLPVAHMMELLPLLLSFAALLVPCDSLKARDSPAP